MKQTSVFKVLVEDVVTVEEQSSEAKVSGKSPESVGSEETQTASGKKDVILVSSMVLLDSASGEITIEFFVNQEQRADVGAVEGSSQGDHSISYISILEAMLSSTDSQSINAAIDLILSLGKSILSAEGLGKFNNVKYPQVHKTEERKLIVALVKNIINSKEKESKALVAEDEIQQLLEKLQISELSELTSLPSLLNNELKLAKVSALTNYLSTLSSTLLTEIQNEELTAFYSVNRIKPAAGAKEKSAARALTMLNRLCELSMLYEAEKDSPKLIEKLNIFRKSLGKNSGSNSQYENVVRYGLNVWHKEETTGRQLSKKEMDKVNREASKKTDALLEGLEKAEQYIPSSMGILNELLGDIMSIKIKKLIGCMGDLMDYEYELQFSLIGKGKDKNKSVEEMYDQIVQHFPKEAHRFKTVGDKLTVIRTDPVILADVLTRFVVIMSAAFPNLKAYMDIKGIFDEVYHRWLEEQVLEKGWNNLKYPTKTGDEVPINIEYLMSEISNNINIRLKKANQDESKQQCIML